MFNETVFPISDEQPLHQLIESVRHVIENIQYGEVISRYVDVESLKQLAVRLIEMLWTMQLEAKKQRIVNGLIEDIQTSLRMRTAAITIREVDFHRVMLNRRKVARFSEIVECLQEDGVILEESIQGFTVRATKGAFKGALELKSANGNKGAFKDAFDHYGSPYDYLRALLAKDEVNLSEIYRLFTSITYKIINADGFEVSGGERSEFRLLQEIKDAQNYDMLLLDEPESSFDNMFLRANVNRIIKEVSETMPVVVVTHNSTVGASVGADYLLYASKAIEEGGIKYRVYAGHPTDGALRSLDGRIISNHLITMNTLEAGQAAYEERRREYEALKGRK